MKVDLTQPNIPDNRNFLNPSKYSFTKIKASAWDPKALPQHQRFTTTSKYIRGGVQNFVKNVNSMVYKMVPDLSREDQELVPVIANRIELALMNMDSYENRDKVELEIRAAVMDTANQLLLGAVLATLAITQIKNLQNQGVIPQEGDWDGVTQEAKEHIEYVQSQIETIVSTFRQEYQNAYGTDPFEALQLMDQKVRQAIGDFKDQYFERIEEDKKIVKEIENPFDDAALLLEQIKNALLDKGDDYTDNRKFLNDVDNPGQLNGFDEQIGEIPEQLRVAIKSGVDQVQNAVLQAANRKIVHVKYTYEQALRALNVIGKVQENQQKHLKDLEMIQDEVFKVAKAREKVGGYREAEGAITLDEKAMLEEKFRGYSGSDVLKKAYVDGYLSKQQADMLMASDPPLYSPKVAAVAQYLQPDSGIMAHARQPFGDTWDPTKQLGNYVANKVVDHAMIPLKQVAQHISPIKYMQQLGLIDNNWSMNLNTNPQSYSDTYALGSMLSLIGLVYGIKGTAALLATFQKNIPLVRGTARVLSLAGRGTRIVTQAAILGTGAMMTASLAQEAMQASMFQDLGTNVVTGLLTTGTMGALAGIIKTIGDQSGKAKSASLEVVQKVGLAANALKKGTDLIFTGESVLHGYINNEEQLEQASNAISSVISGLLSPFSAVMGGASYIKDHVKNVTQMIYDTGKRLLGQNQQEPVPVAELVARVARSTVIDRKPQPFVRQSNVGFIEKPKI